MLTWTIARRFSRSLRRNGFSRFSSAVAVTSVCLGTLAVCLSQSILSGYEEIIQQTAARFGMSITVQNHDGAPLADDAAAAVISSITGVSSVSDAIRQETLVKVRNKLDGAILVGLQPGHIRHAFDGLMTNSCPPGMSDFVMVGSGLARRLNMHVGDSLTIITRSIREQVPAIARVRISSVFTSGMASYDEHAVVTSTDFARKIIRAPSTASSMLMITCLPGVDEEGIVRSINMRLSNNMLVLTYRDHFASMWNWIDLQRRPIPVIMSLIAIVSMFTVVTTILLSIVEKTRSIAMLATLGMSPWKLSLVTAFRVLTTSVTGVSVGLLLSTVLIAVQRTWHVIRLDGSIYYVQHLPVALEPLVLLRSGLLILLAACLAATVPMIITMRIRPIRALRFR
ncbi:MAG: ABC transporter permease [Candidatus Kapabacteria bacterium]|nr:ABC transporter permease [Candidatus Kapabacteria bacterium]